MRTAAVRVISLVFAAIFALSGLVTGTLSWQSISQQAKNETKSEIVRQVELFKLEKQPDGTETTAPVPGAVFYLFTADGAQLGGRYVTDDEGKIAVELKPGDYYFEEYTPPPGFMFDTDEQLQRITRYPFIVTDQGTDPVVVTAYNIRLQGALTIEKLVENADSSAVTDEQKQQAFGFTVTFSDGGAYEYTVDGGAPQQITSGGTLTLKHGQTAVFQNIPVGVAYTVIEQPVPGYTVSGTGHAGTITAEGCRARFVNTYAPGETGRLIVTKEVVDVSTDGSADFTKAFTFTAVIGGKEVTFTLKHGESKVFPDLPVGTTYTVTETDYKADGYTALVQSYTGVIQSADGVQLPFVNIYAAPKGLGSLRVTKEVVGEHADPNLAFTFEVGFSDGKAYPYTINGGELITPDGDGPVMTLRLKDGQIARFEGIPEGVTYTVKETDPLGYRQDLSEAGGTIVGDSAYVIFRNRVPDKPEKPAKLTVTKKLAGECPKADQDKKFRFTLTIDGREQEFILKSGETKEFEIPAGASYDVREDDYFPDGYALTLENGAGTAQPGQTITVAATNTYVGEVQTEIKGQKTWALGDYDVTLPESITVRLKHGEVTVEEITVTPDEKGAWHYAFTVPKYDADGSEIAYAVEEAPVAGFSPSYDGFDIVNTYFPPIEIDPPVIWKAVEDENAPDTDFAFLLRGEEGAPMPEGSSGSTKIVTRTGIGEVELGTFSFAAPGVYTYTVSELNTGADGWKYDTTVYTLTFTVTLENGALHASRTLTKDGELTETARFTNRYTPQEPDTVEIAGTKTWRHGDNPEANRPDSIIVYVYADRELAAQLLVRADDNWRYALELPRYAPDGHEITYTVGEAEVPGYTAEINGYDLVNTYAGTTPEPPVPGNPDNPGGPQTGDSTNIWPWLTAMIFSLCGMIVTLLMGRRNRRRSKEK